MIQRTLINTGFEVVFDELDPDRERKQTRQTHLEV